MRFVGFRGSRVDTAEDGFETLRKAAFEPRRRPMTAIEHDADRVRDGPRRARRQATWRAYACCCGVYVPTAFSIRPTAP
jgi:hypothetical protein